VLALAAATAAGAAREEDLQALRNRIDGLTRELQQKEDVKREARDALRESERAISEANRTLAGLQAEARKLRAEQGQLAAQRASAGRALAARRDSLERLLAARAASGPADALRVALSGDDPALVARQLYYVGYVTRAAAQMLDSYRAGLADLDRLAREARARAERLRGVEQATRADRERIVRERAARRRVLERVGGEIRAGRREIRVLRADEMRLSRLVEELGRMVTRIEITPEPAASPAARREPFSKQRGKLRLPVRGELTGRFGAPRGAAGTEAKGVFIRAAEGQPVRAIAPGQVVFADWIRGFGNLLIVDHGEAYLSIYANNESLLKQVGDAVGTGERIATTGSSGGNEETGLYFELRHLGRPFDPLRWVRVR